jgi:hypothetical protein
MLTEKSQYFATHPSRFVMGQFLAGGLDNTLEREIHDHLRGCGSCGRIFSEARGTAAAFAVKFPEWETLRRTRRQRRLAATERELRIFGFLPKWLGLTPRFALAGLVFLAGAGYLGLGKHAQQGDLTAKGDARFYLFINGAQASRDTVECAPSDTLQLGLTSPGPQHYAVLYRDDQEGIRVYMESAKMKPVGKPQGENLPHSLVLQSDWKEETIFCISSPAPFTAADARSAIDGKNPRRPLRLQTYHLVNGRL